MTIHRNTLQTIATERVADLQREAPDWRSTEDAPKLSATSLTVPSKVHQGLVPARGQQ